VQDTNVTVDLNNSFAILVNLNFPEAADVDALTNFYAATSGQFYWCWDSSLAQLVIDFVEVNWLIFLKLFLLRFCHCLYELMKVKYVIL